MYETLLGMKVFFNQSSLYCNPFLLLFCCFLELSLALPHAPRLYSERSPRRQRGSVLEVGHACRFPCRFLHPSGFCIFSDTLMGGRAAFWDNFCPSSSSFAMATAATLPVGFFLLLIFSNLSSQLCCFSNAIHQSLLHP